MGDGLSRCGEPGLGGDTIQSFVISYWCIVFVEMTTAHRLSHRKRGEHRRNGQRFRRWLEFFLFAAGFVLLSLLGIYLGINYHH